MFEYNCIGCHNVNPNKDGSIGPALAGSNKELVLSKVLKGIYPVGYKPKRDTKIMPVMNWLTVDDVESIAKYLEGVK
jgi:mono/diheme cytochrome c family protein